MQDDNGSVWHYYVTLGRLALNRSKDVASTDDCGLCEMKQTNVSTRKGLKNASATCTCFTPAAGCTRLTDTDDPPNTVRDTLSSVEAIAAHVLLHGNTIRCRRQV